MSFELDINSPFINYHYYGMNDFGNRNNYDWFGRRDKFLEWYDSGKPLHAKVTKTNRAGSIYRVENRDDAFKFYMNNQVSGLGTYIQFGDITDEIRQNFNQSITTTTGYGQPYLSPAVFISTSTMKLVIDGRPRHVEWNKDDKGWKKHMVLLFDYEGETIYVDEKPSDPYADWSVTDRFGAVIKIGDAITAVHATSSRSGSVESIFGKLVGFSKYKCPIVKDVLTGEEVTLRNCKPEKMVRIDKSLMDRIMMAKLTNG